MRLGDLILDLDGFRSQLLDYAEYAGQEGDYDYYEMLTSEANLIEEVVNRLKTCANTEIFLTIAMRQIKTWFPKFNVESYVLHLESRKNQYETEIVELQRNIDKLDANIQKLKEV